MAKRRIVPLFDLLTRPSPEQQDAAGSANGHATPTPNANNANGKSATGANTGVGGIGGYGVRGPLPKPVVRLNVATASKPLAQNLPSAPAQTHKTPVAPITTATHAAPAVASIAASTTNTATEDDLDTPTFSSAAEANAVVKREVPVVRVNDIASSIFAEKSDASASAIEAKPSHKFVGSSSTIPPIHGETLEPVPEFDAAKARTAAAIAHQAASLSAAVDAESQRESKINARTISLGIFVAIVLGVGIYALAYKLGFSSGKERTEELVRRDPPVVREPVGTNGNQPSGSIGVPNIGSATPTTLNNPSTDRTTPTESRPATTTQQVPTPAPKTQTPPINTKPNAKGIIMPQGLGTQRYELLPHNPNDFLTARGWEVTEPRTVGLNYMMVATLSTQDAGEAVEFLAANGLEAFAVPILEKPRQGTKDTAPPSGQPSKYRVFVGPGLSSEEVKADKDRPLKARIAELGTFWNKDAKKPTDFREPYLIKHVEDR